MGCRQTVQKSWMRVCGKRAEGGGGPSRLWELVLKYGQYGGVKKEFPSEVCFKIGDGLVLDVLKKKETRMASGCRNMISMAGSAEERTVRLMRFSAHLIALDVE